MELRELKKGEYFTLKPIEKPTERQVLIRGEYDRTTKKYICYRFHDISESVLRPGNRTVYTDFTF